MVYTGTGTILSGILLGLRVLPTIYGISACISNEKKASHIRSMTSLADWQRKYDIQACLTLVPEIMGYYEACDTEVPFPCSPYYDRKAWKWMLQNLDNLKDPVVFWDIGQL